MKFILKIIFYLPLFSFLSCQDNQDNLLSSRNSSGIVTQPNILRNFDPKLISTLQDKQERSIKLNDLIKDVENSSFYINDHIVFSAEQNSQANKNTTLHIQTQCIEPETQKKFTKRTTMKYKNEIMLIELIPEQLFSYGNPWWTAENTKNPTCDFHFEATNKEGDIHYFELPHLPVLSFDNSLNLSLIPQKPSSSTLERVETFPILNFNQIENYAVISGKNTTVNQLKLICEKFQLFFDVDNLKYHDLWKLQGWTSIPEENRVNQPCRFVSLNKGHIVGVSQLFPLVFPTQGITTQLITDPKQINALEDKYPLSVKGYDFNGRVQLKSDFAKDHNLGTYHNLAVLKIENQSIDQVHLYLPQIDFYADVHFLYDGLLHTFDISVKNDQIKTLMMYDQGFFITMENNAQFILTSSLTKAKNQSVEVNDTGSQAVYDNNKVLLTVEPGATALIPLSVNVKKRCRFKNQWLINNKWLQFVKNIGMIFEGRMFPIYQVLDITNFHSAQNTIIASLLPKTEKEQSSFRLDIISDPSTNINKHFYKNICAGLRTSKMDIASVVHQGTWEAHSINKKGEKKLQFTKNIKHSFSQARSDFIVETAKNISEKYKKEKKEKKKKKK